MSFLLIFIYEIWMTNESYCFCIGTSWLIYIFYLYFENTCVSHVHSTSEINEQGKEHVDHSKTIN
jgi:hypothetical protein